MERAIRSILQHFLSLLGVAGGLTSCYHGGACTTPVCYDCSTSADQEQCEFCQGATAPVPADLYDECTAAHGLHVDNLCACAWYPIVDGRFIVQQCQHDDDCENLPGTGCPGPGFFTACLLKEHYQ